MPSITICVFLTLTNSFKLFDQNLALTGGDPNHFTEMLALNIYQTFYARAGAQWKGLGQAKAVLFCVLVIAISMIQLKATRSREVQQHLTVPVLRLVFFRAYVRNNTEQPEQ